MSGALLSLGDQGVVDGVGALVGRALEVAFRMSLERQALAIWGDHISGLTD